MYWISLITIPFAAAALALYVSKKYPWIKPHHEFVILSIAVIIVNLIAFLFGVPMITNLYNEFGAKPNYMIDPTILCAVITIILVGFITALLTLKSFQQKFDGIFSNKAPALLLGILLSFFVSGAYAFVVFSQIYNLSAVI